MYAVYIISLNLFVDRFWRADLCKMAVVQHGWNACTLPLSQVSDIFEPCKTSDPQTQYFNFFLLSSCEAYSVFSFISRCNNVQNEVYHICAWWVFKFWKWWEGSQKEFWGI